MPDESCPHIAAITTIIQPTPRVRRVREDRRAMGASADLSGVRRDALLRRFTKPARQQTRARERTSGDCVGRA